MGRQRYRIDDDECRQILMQEPGEKNDLLNFENKVLSKVVYFEQLFDACDVQFIDNAAKAAKPA